MTTDRAVGGYIDTGAVIYDQDGDIVLLPTVCIRCGALVVDQRLHDEFHGLPSKPGQRGE